MSCKKQQDGATAVLRIILTSWLVLITLKGIKLCFQINKKKKNVRKEKKVTKDVPELESNLTQPINKSKT